MWQANECVKPNIYPRCSFSSCGCHSFLFSLYSVFQLTVAEAVEVSASTITLIVMHAQLIQNTYRSAAPVVWPAPISPHGERNRSEFASVWGKCRAYIKEFLSNYQYLLAFHICSSGGEVKFGLPVVRHRCVNECTFGDIGKVSGRDCWGICKCSLLM